MPKLKRFFIIFVAGAPKDQGALSGIYNTLPEERER